MITVTIAMKDNNFELVVDSADDLEVITDELVRIKDFLNFQESQDLRIVWEKD